MPAATTRPSNSYRPGGPSIRPYAYGNHRVSCRYCILGSLNDLQVAARHDTDGLLEKLIRMEDHSGFTFKQGFSLKALKV
jgi:hypothetical protein